MSAIVLQTPEAGSTVEQSTGVPASSEMEKPTTNVVTGFFPVGGCERSHATSWARLDGQQPLEPVVVRRGCRLGAWVWGLVVCGVLALPGSLVTFAYNAEVATRGATTLRWLAVGQAAFAMLSLATTILVSLGKEKDAMTITAVALAFVVVANVLGLPRASFGEAQLLVTAQATTTALALAMAVAVLRVRKVAGAFVPAGTAARVGACVAGAFLLGGALPVLPKLATPLAGAAVGVVYLVALVATRELGREDLGLVLAVVRRRAKR